MNTDIRFIKYYLEVVNQEYSGNLKEFGETCERLGIIL